MKSLQVDPQTASATVWLDKSEQKLTTGGNNDVKIVCLEKQSMDS
jgi:hypothetical protein